GMHVAAFDARGKNAIVAQEDGTARGLGGATGELPQLHTPAPLQVDRQQGLAPVHSTSGIGGHERRFGLRLVENGDIHPEMGAIPPPGGVDVRHAQADLLYPTDDGVHRGSLCVPQATRTTACGGARWSRSRMAWKAASVCSTS